MQSDLIDRTTTLCLACSASLPPVKSPVSVSAHEKRIYITNCCQRPICPSCIMSNPRLARYNPCLACLAGVDLVGLGSANKLNLKGNAPVSPHINVDGSTRDQDTFVLGDDEDEDEMSAEEPRSRDTPPPLYTDIKIDSVYKEHSQSSTSVSDVTPSLQHSLESQIATNDLEPSIPVDSTRTAPYKYYLNKKDTLQGICLRFGLDGHELCKLNNLPLSVIRTTPHLLHTRAFLLIPASANPHPSLTTSTSEGKSREEKLVRERAEKRLQTLTKEVDYRVAKAYIALADDPQEQEMFSAKIKETGVSAIKSDVSMGRGLEALAIGQYLDDDEWEAEQLRSGRVPQILPLPMKGMSVTQKGTGRWWDFKK